MGGQPSAWSGLPIACSSNATMAAAQLRVSNCYSPAGTSDVLLSGANKATHRKAPRPARLAGDDSKRLLPFFG